MNREKVSLEVTFDVLWSYHQLLTISKALSDVLNNNLLYVPPGQSFIYDIPERNTFC